LIQRAKKLTEPFRKVLEKEKKYVSFGMTAEIMAYFD